MRRLRLARMPRGPARSRRGAILIVVLWVVAILAVVCLSLAGAARFQQVQVRRFRDDLQTEQSLLSAVELAKQLVGADQLAADTLWDAWSGELSEPFTLQMEGQAVARVVLTVPGADPPRFGLQDESARINANTATAEMLAQVPGLSSGEAEAFVTLRDSLVAEASPPAGLTGPLATLPQLAQALAQAFVEAGSFEIDPTGPDELPPAVRQAMGYLTVYTRHRNTDAQGRPRVNINAASPAEIAEATEGNFSDEQIEGIVNARAEKPFASIGELLTREMRVTGPDGKPEIVRIRAAEFKPAADRLTATDAEILAGLVNVNTAPAEVLRCLPGLTDDRGGAIISRRTEGIDSPGPGSIAWLLDVVDEATFETLCPYVTTRTAQFRMHAETVARSAPGERTTGDTVATSHHAQAVLERDGGRCGVLAWATWRGPASGQDPAQEYGFEDR